MPDDECVEQLALQQPASTSATVADDLVVMLDLLAETIVQALGFGVAVVNIACPDGSLQAVSVAGDDDARKALLGTVERAELWDELLAASEPWGQLRFADHRSEAADIGVMSWIPDITPSGADGAWHPEDALFAPLVALDGTRLGILSVDCPRNGCRPDDATREALEAFAISAALAIEHSTFRRRAEDSERRYRHLASHDQLTGVGNRSMLMERRQRGATDSAQDRTLSAVVFIDLDGFKAINDTRSHEIGDHVLRTVADRIRQAVRRQDMVVRWGGDEFVVLLENLASERVAQDITERITTALAEPLRHISPVLVVTASVGVAFSHPTDQLTTEELLKQADAAMYGVKDNGRNAWAVFEPEPTQA